MSDDLKLPQVGELTLPQWQDWLMRYNAVLSDRESRIEKLEAALKFLIRCEEVNESAAKAAGQPYVNKGLDFARMLIGMEKKDD